MVKRVYIYIFVKQNFLRTYFLKYKEESQKIIKISGPYLLKREEEEEVKNGPISVLQKRLDKICIKSDKVLQKKLGNL